MNISIKSKELVQRNLAALLAAVLIGGLASSLSFAQPPSDAPPDAGQVAVKRKLSGAELYSMHCNRCHPERYPTERTAAQWKTIVLHMEVRANLPRSQARLILKYLQENSGR